MPHQQPLSPNLGALGAAEKRRKKEGRGKENDGERLHRAGRGETRRETGREKAVKERGGTESRAPAAAWV